MNEKIQSVLNSLPHKPGIYIMKDSEGTILYVGKAISLYNRVRSFHRDGNRYFGPYTNSGAVDATLDLLNKLFAFRTCRYDASTWAPPAQGDPPATWKQKLLPRPCTQYYIHRCIAPCVAYATREEYNAVIKQVILFLEGKHDEVVKALQAKMQAPVDNLNFAEAARMRDCIKGVER